MLHKINDSPQTAHELGQLLKGRNMIVNLIPWNPVYSPGMQLEAPGSERVAEFQRIVREHYDIFCTVRQEMGQDISGNIWGLSCRHWLLVSTLRQPHRMLAMLPFLCANQ